MRIAFELEHRGDETPSDFASRLSVRNWRDDLRKFCLDFGLDAQALIDGDTVAVSALAELAGADAAALMREAFIRQDGTRNYVHRGQHLVWSSLTRSRVRMCPACMKEDMERLDVRDSARPYRRSQWIIRPLRTCLRHGMALVEIGSEDGPSYQHHTSGIIARALSGLDGLVEAASRREASPFEQYVAGRLSGGTGSPWLDGLPLYAAMHLCFVLGSVERHGPKVTLGDLDEAEVWHGEAEGFGIASDGVAGIRSLLDRLQADGGKDRRARGPKVLYGRLYDWLAHESDDPVYDTVRDVIVEHSLDTLPFGPGDVLFGRAVGERRLHSVRSVSQDTGLHPKRLRKLLRRAGAVEGVTGALADSRVTVDAGAAEKLLEGLEDTVSLEGVRDYLNVPRPHDRGLFERGLIRPLVLGGRRDVDHAFGRRDLDAFLERLLAKADPAHAGDPDFVSLIHAAKHSCRAVMDVVGLVLDDRLERVGVDPAEHGFMSILVDRKEVRSLLVGPTYDGLSLKEVEQELRIRTAAVKGLVESGFLEHRIVKNPVTGWMQPIVPHEAFEQFRREYVTLNGLARECGEHFRRVKKALVAAGVEPVADPGKLDVTLYRRAHLPP